MKTIREQLERSRGKCFVFALCALAGFIIGLVLLAAHPTAIVLVAIAFFTYTGSIFYLIYWIKCPRCRGRIGHSLTWPPGGVWKISSRLKHCVFCGVDFDTEPEQ